MIDWHAIIGECNRSVDVHCRKLSLSLSLVCLFLFRFGEALKKMVPARKKNKWHELLCWTPFSKQVAPISTSTWNGCRHLYIYLKWLPLSLHLLKTVANISTSTQNVCHHLYIYSKQVDVIRAGQKNPGTFSDSWNWKNWWQERIPNRREHVTYWQEIMLQSEK